MVKRMETKQVAVILLVLAAIAASVYVLTLPQEVPPEPGNGEEEPAEYLPPFEEGTNTTLQEFASNLLLAQTVYIVEDIRGLDEKYPISRNNIMQCAVDYAGSPGIVGKELQVYALEGDVCTNYQGEIPIKDCYADVLEAAGRMDTVIIWIEKGESPEFYSRGIIVRVNEDYVQGMCSINVIAPQQEEEPQPEPQINNTEEAEPPVPGEELPEEPATGEMLPEEVPGPGDSHTFP